MRLIESKGLTVIDPSKSFKSWCKSTLVINNPEYAKLKRLGKWTGRTPKFIYLYEERDGNYHLPYGLRRELHYRFIFDDIKQEHHELRRIFYHDKDMDLREYQEDALFDMMCSGGGILQAPAGSGKTQIALAYVFSRKVKALWLTHTVDLVEQTYSRAAQFVSEDLLGKITGGKIAIGKGLTVATVQTMNAMDLSLYEDEWDVVIVDECHRCAGSPAQLRMFTRVLSHLNARSKFGLTATLHRSDGLTKTTEAYLGPVFHTVSQAAVKEHIVTPSVLRRDTGVGLSRECLDVDGTIVYQKLLSYLCSSQNRNELIINDLRFNRNHYNLILSSRVSHLCELKDKLPANTTVLITGSTPKSQRESLINDVRQGKAHYLLATFPLAKEGLDIPILDRVYFTTPQKDYAVVTQAVGRVDRVHEGKTSAIVYDYVDYFKYAERAWRQRIKHYKKAGCTFV